MTVSTPAPRSTRTIPEGYHSLTPVLIVNDAAKAIEFYARAFGAVELFRMASPDGKSIWHVELQIGDSRLMMGGEFPDMGMRAPTSLGGSPSSLHIYVEDVDAAFERATDAGATVTMPLMDMFWGDRYGTVTDPFGHRWSLATHVEDVSPEEIERRALTSMAGCQ